MERSRPVVKQRAKWKLIFVGKRLVFCTLISESCDGSGVWGEGISTEIIIAISDLHFDQNIAGSLMSPQVSSYEQPYDIFKVDLSHYGRPLTGPFLDAKILNGFTNSTVRTRCSILVPPRPDPV